MGNSPKIVRDHYPKIIEHMHDKQAAHEYWSIQPLSKHNRKIVRLGYQRRFDTHGTLYDSQRFEIECPAPSTTIFLAMKNSIIFISALSLVAMMLASCASTFAPDETATTGATRQTNETPPSEAPKVMAIQSVVDITNRIL